MTPDFKRLPPLSADGSAREAAGGFTLRAGDHAVAVSAYAPGIFRVRIGGAGGPDYGILARGAEPPEATVERLDGATRIAAGDLRLTVDHAPLRVTLARGAEVLTSWSTDAHFRRRHRLPPFARTDRGWFAAFDLRSGEPVYGLGEKWGPLNRRGQLVVSRNEDALGVNAEASYKNCPFAWSPRGWGAFVHTPARVTHAVGHAQWSHRSYAVEVEDDVLDLFLIAADDPAGVIERYTWLTGRAPVPPRWSLGVWMSRAYYRTAEEAMGIAREIRARRIPCDVFTLDGRAWLVVETRFAFEWDAGRYPDPAAFARELKGLGFRLCVWEYPYVSVHNPLFAELAAKGWLLKDAETGEAYRYAWDPEPFGEVLTTLPTSGFLDFTNPDAYAYWRDRHAELFDVGVDVVKTDFGEQIVDGVVAHNGDLGARLHNVYPLLYNRCVFEATARFKGPENAVVFGRSGWAGSQRHPVQWGGDPQTDWEALAASIRGGLSWGMSGVPCYAHDVGGFYGDQPDPELYVRWTQAAVFASHLRFHGIGPREPWFYGAEAERIVRDWLEFRYRLIPYVEGSLEEASRNGLPVMRAMPLAFPEDPAAWAFDTQYLFGPAVLVAPVLRPGGGATVYLPPGGWYDLWTGERHEGGRVLELRMPLDRIPAFGREGHLLPLGPIAQHTGELPTDDRRLEMLWCFGVPTATPCAGGLSPRLERAADGRVRLTGVPTSLRVREFGAVEPVAADGGFVFHPK